MVWILPIVVTPELSTIVTIPPKVDMLMILVRREMEQVWVDVFERERLTLLMSTALQHNGTLLMRGSDARNTAMIKRTVILLRSEHKQGWVTVILIVIFTRRMNAKKRAINQWELRIMYVTKIFIRTSMMTLESGVVFVVRLVEERMIMPAVTLHTIKLHQRSSRRLNRPSHQHQHPPSHLIA